MSKRNGRPMPSANLPATPLPSAIKKLGLRVNQLRRRGAGVYEITLIVRADGELEIIVDERKRHIERLT